MTLRHLVGPLLAVAAFAPLGAKAQAARPLPELDAQVPCTVLRSEAHGVIVLGARPQSQGGPPCDIMAEYRDWMQRSDDLLQRRREPSRRLTGREWDFASGAMRIGAPNFFVLIRGDSLPPARPSRPRRLYLTALAADENSALDTIGSWYVLVDEDSTSSRMFRSAVTERRLRTAFENRFATVMAVPGARVDAGRIDAQIAEARALREALGFTDPLPVARFLLGRAEDTTLTMLGVVSKRRALFAMMVYPPLAVFAPVSAVGGLDSHELVHVATFGRREFVPGAVGEAFAMHHGGSHGRSFAQAFCSSKVFTGLPPLSPAQVDSAATGRWWADARADAGGFVLGHAIGWFIRVRGDSAWIFAEGEPARDNDAIGFLAQRSGFGRDTALAGVTASLEERRAACGVTAADDSRATRLPPSAGPAGQRQGRR